MFTYICNFSMNTNIFSKLLLQQGWSVIMERLVPLPGSYFCDTVTFGTCLYFLKSYIIAGGCYIFRICLNIFITILIKFLFWKSLGWSATKRDGQTSSEKTAYVNQTGVFSFFFKTSHNVGWNTLNLRKELKQASHRFNLRLETTLLKFKQLYPRHLC